MTELWTILLPILITDLMNPVLLAATVYALGTADPYRNAAFLILGHTVAYLLAGFALAIGLERLLAMLQNPGPIDFAIELAIGLALLYVGFISVFGKTKPSKPEFDNGGTLGVGSAFVLGATLNVIGLPFAIPYLAALDQILKADLDLIAGSGVLVVYNLVYAAPFAAIIILRAMTGPDGEQFLAKVSEWVDRISGFLMPALLLLLGAALTIDAAWYFLHGTPLIPI